MRVEYIVPKKTNSEEVKRDEDETPKRIRIRQLERRSSTSSGSSSYSARTLLDDTILHAVQTYKPKHRVVLAGIASQIYVDRTHCDTILCTNKIIHIAFSLNKFVAASGCKLCAHTQQSIWLRRTSDSAVRNRRITLFLLSNMVRLIRLVIWTFFYWVFLNDREYLSLLLLFFQVRAIIVAQESSRIKQKRKPTVWKGDDKHFKALGWNVS